MCSKRGAGVSPPQQGHARAGIAGAEQMTTVRTRLIRIGFILGLLALLVSGVSIEPNQVLARPVYSGGPSGEPYGTGDPTGDDIPSPTPKPSALRAAKLGLSGSHTQRPGSFDSYRLSVYFNILIRLGIR